MILHILKKFVSHREKATLALTDCHPKLCCNCVHCRVPVVTTGHLWWKVVTPDWRNAVCNFEAPDGDGLELIRGQGDTPNYPFCTTQRSTVCGTQAKNYLSTLGMLHGANFLEIRKTTES